MTTDEIRDRVATQLRASIAALPEHVRDALHRQARKYGLYWHRDAEESRKVEEGNGVWVLCELTTGRPVSPRTTIRGAELEQLYQLGFYQRSGSYTLDPEHREMVLDRKLCGMATHHTHTAGQPHGECGAWALPGKEHCDAHDPERVKARQERASIVHRAEQDRDTAIRWIKSKAEAYARAAGVEGAAPGIADAGEQLLHELTKYGRLLLAAEARIAELQKKR